MNNIEQINNKKLRESLLDSQHFTTLDENEKQKYLTKILELDEKKQEEIYLLLTYEEEMEKVRMLSKLNQKVNTLGGKINQLISMNDEIEQSKKDKLEEIQLQKNLN